MWGQSAMDQSRNRQYTVFVDQHDREWGAQTENKSRHPTGTVTPLFKAPWTPDPTCFRYNPKRQNEVFIDYDAIMGADREARKAQLALQHKAAARFNVLGWDPSQGPTAQMKHDIGDPPLPLGELAKACKAGNKYLLGFMPFNPERPDHVKLKGLLEEIEARFRFTAEGETDVDGAEYAEPDAEEEQEISNPVKAKARRTLANAEA